MANQRNTGASSSSVCRYRCSLKGCIYSRNYYCCCHVLLFFRKGHSYTMPKLNSNYVLVQFTLNQRHIKNHNRVKELIINAPHLPASSIFIWSPADRNFYCLQSACRTMTLFLMCRVSQLLEKMTAAVRWSQLLWCSFLLEPFRPPGEIQHTLDFWTAV